MSRKVSRRSLLASAAAIAAASQVPSRAAAEEEPKSAGKGPPPVAVASANGLKAVALAVQRMKEGRDPLDAAIEGVNLVEDDPDDMTVGYGGVPNEEGVVQLDACVFHGPTARAGAVASLEGCKNPSKVAKLVMETTDHVLLVGAGARKFADAHGFAHENILTERARKVWLYWKQNLSALDKWLEPELKDVDPDVKWFMDKYGKSEFREQTIHGTIHCSAVDAKGDLAGTTTTSGLFFKMPGRVGDSPIIGAGCFTDNDVGSAGATGRGEANILVSGGHLAVEAMRAGKHPRDACVQVLKRIAATTKQKRLLDEQGRPRFGITFYAVNKQGQYGGASMWKLSGGGKRTRFAVADASSARLEECAYLFDGKATM